MKEDENPPNSQGLDDQNTKNQNINKDWDETNFPTSVKPVIKKVLLMICSIIFLCWFVYYISEEPVENKPAKANNGPEIPPNSKLTEEDAL